MIYWFHKSFDKSILQQSHYRNIISHYATSLQVRKIHYLLNRNLSISPTFHKLELLTDSARSPRSWLPNRTAAPKKKETNTENFELPLTFSARKRRSGATDAHTHTCTEISQLPKFACIDSTIVSAAVLCVCYAFAARNLAPEKLGWN